MPLHRERSHHFEQQSNQVAYHRRLRSYQSMSIRNTLRKRDVPGYAGRRPETDLHHAITSTGYPSHLQRTRLLAQANASVLDVGLHRKVFTGLVKTNEIILTSDILASRPIHNTEDGVELHCLRCPDPNVMWHIIIPRRKQRCIMVPGHGTDAKPRRYSFLHILSTPHQNQNEFTYIGSGWTIVTAWGSDAAWNTRVLLDRPWATSSYTIT